MFDNWNTILIISSHTDDAELSMGGTISRFIQDGYEVHHAILSSAPEQAIARGYDPKQLISESKEANEVLGIMSDNYHLFDMGYPTDYFYLARQEIANSLNRLKLMINPDVVFVSSSFDTHQDHQVTHQEAVRIFKEVGILGYEFPYNNLKFDYDLLVGLTEGDMEHKMEAIRCFKSQQDKIYFEEDYIMSLAKINAVRMKSTYPYAEVFEVVRLVW